MEINRVGSFTLSWGESLVWDDRRNRLYFVDCANSMLLWLDDGADEPHSLVMPSMPTGVVPTTSGELVIVLDDGLHVCDPDAERVELLSPFPLEIGGRCNDACADLDGNIITGKLNTGQAPGSVWQYSSAGVWSLLDSDISNTNGPAVLDDGTLIVGDTSADYYRYDYDAAAATATSRTVFGDVDGLGGKPDGSTCDVDGGLWCALVGGSKLARFTHDGLDATIVVPARLPTDVALGGAAMDRLYVTSIDGDGELDGALLVIDGVPTPGRPELRARL